MEKINELYSLYLKFPAICTDTRKIIKGAIFFALKGDSFNANSMALQALDNGCSYAVIDEDKYKVNEKFILVDDVLKTLQELAAFHRKQLKIPVLGITGSNGKTTTKELIHAVLSEKYKVHSTSGNFNNHIGVPLTLLSCEKDVEFVVVEMGANHPGEIGKLCEIADPDFGIITNIGKAHIEGFGSLEGVVRTKNELYAALADKKGKVFVCRDNGLLMNLSGGLSRLTYGMFPGSDCYGEILDSNPFLKLKWRGKYSKDESEIATNLVGFYNFENVLAAICIGEYFEVNEGQIKSAIENYYPCNNRSQVINTEKNFLIMDAYNANPTSMEAALRNFMQTTAGRKFAIIGDMLELGIESEKEHAKIIELAVDAGFEEIIFVGKIFTSLKSSFNYPAFTDVTEAAAWLNSKKPEGYTILIKGSRGIKLEKLLGYL